MELIKEAISHFKYGVTHDIFKPTIVKYAILVIGALEKMKSTPVRHEKTFWKYYHYCPACGSQLEKENLNYCSNCGQKLDWSNYWEALKT